MTIEVPGNQPDEDLDRLTSAAHALARLCRHLEHSLHDAQLTLPQYRLLLFLKKRPDAANRMAANLHVKPPSLTALVDGLESRGLVARSTDDTDRRRIRIEITDSGRSLLGQADKLAAERLSYIEGHDPQERDLVDSLRAWHDALEFALEQRSPQ